MKFFKIAFFVITFSITFTPISAETYLREYTYQASELDSKITSRDFALKQLKRELIEYIGVHIKSEITLHQNSDGYQFFNEDVQALSAGVTKLEVIDEKWNGKEFYIKASIDVDASSLFSEFKLIQDNVKSLSSDINFDNPDKVFCDKKFTSASAESIYSEAIKIKNKQKEKQKKEKKSYYSPDKRVIEYTRCAAYFGDPQAQFDMFLSEKSTYDKLNKINWLASSAKNGNAAAMYWFSRVMYGGYTIRKPDRNTPKKYFWLYKSAIKEYPNAMYEIARAHYHGGYYEKDLKEAERWLLKSINNSSSDYFFEKDNAIFLLQQIQIDKLKQ